MTELRKRRAGILLPLASLLSESSFECGDIASLLPLGDFAKKAGFSIIQILPLNDTGLGKSPYSAISSVATDPLYISLHHIGIPLHSRRKAIATQRIHHTRIRDLKLEALKKFFHQDKTTNVKLAKEFLSRFSWLEGYASFRVLFDKHKGLPWWDWRDEYKLAESGKSIVQKKEEEEFYFYIFLQRIAFEQSVHVKAELEKKGVFLKGDMPILISRNSSDVWEYPDLFHLDLQAGAPPDAFSESGQNWGFPALNWESIEREDYRWWKQRLEYLENFFHLYRIDHVIGMYRIWAIPLTQETARFGWFHPQKGVSREEFGEQHLNPDDYVKRGLISEFSSDRFIFHWDFWKSPLYEELADSIKATLYQLSELHLKEDEETWLSAGERALTALSGFSKMMPCAEDLGAVPGFIRDSLKSRKIIGIDVNRWTRSLDDGSYIPPDGYRDGAVSVLSTHDTSVALDWWLSLREGEKAYAESFFFPDGVQGKGPSEILSGLLDFGFSTNSMFAIQMLHDLMFKGDFALLDKFSEHRVNIPGTPEEGNWDYRFRFTAEELNQETDLIQSLREKLTKSDRI